MKTDLFQSYAEFSKLAGILKAALSQHQLSGFEIAQLQVHLLALFVVMLSKAYLTSHSRTSGSRWDHIHFILILLTDISLLIFLVFWYHLGSGSLVLAPGSYLMLF